MIDLLGRVTTAALAAPDSLVGIFDFIEFRDASLSPRLEGRRRHVVDVDKCYDGFGKTTAPIRTAYPAGIVADFQRDVTHGRAAEF